MPTLPLSRVEVDSVTYIEQFEARPMGFGFADEPFGNPDWEAEADALSLAELEYQADRDFCEWMAKRERLVAQPPRLSVIDAWALYQDGKVGLEVYEFVKERYQAEWIGWTLYRLESGEHVMHMAGTSPGMVFKVAKQTGWVGCGGPVRIYEVPTAPVATFESPTLDRPNAA